MVLQLLAHMQWFSKVVTSLMKQLLPSYFRELKISRKSSPLIIGLKIHEIQACFHVPIISNSLSELFF
ncbi:hypothetical protein HZS_7087 [Henneguya salminicola]|nr:hypothetical protein HZS_7087 [Henneguya salminicola]